MIFKFKKHDDPLIYRIFGATLGAVIMFTIEVAQVVIIAAAIIIPIRYFLVKPFIVKGASMEPSFYENDYLIIDEISYRFNEIERGEIVVFRPPNNESQYYIKRVIGLPGETIEIADGKVTIFNDEYPNGILLEEEYIEDYTQGVERETLGSDEYFVLGDNRDHSFDSRNFGPVPEENIVGKVWIRGLPLENLSVFGIPQYNL